MDQTNGIILYRGPSVIDGAPIVVIATGLEDGGSNSKTGPMAQIYIMRDDINPMIAVHTGDDVSICGSCRHRGKIETKPDGATRNVGRTCYVVLMHGPRVVWDAYQRGSYPQVPPKIAARRLAGKRLRVGAYGDPGAVPLEIWDEVLARVRELNSYTHLWRENPALSAFCMASCDNEEEHRAAKALGFRVYRVRPEGAPVLKGEGRCPASKEMGKTVQCSACMLCGGQRTGAKADITIVAHGRGAKQFSREMAA
ncbi:MAG: hypothetical protein KDK08_05300 [Rhizobiaceae bacterium]|nr:hypothetical protein [Rhizobiaceae bacterium]